jgi:hypothetical protein
VNTEFVLDGRSVSESVESDENLSENVGGNVDDNVRGNVGAMLSWINKDRVIFLTSTVVVFGVPAKWKVGECLWSLSWTVGAYWSPSALTKICRSFNVGGNVGGNVGWVLSRISKDRANCRYFGCTSQVPASRTPTFSFHGSRYETGGLTKSSITKQQQ